MLPIIGYGWTRLAAAVGTPSSVGVDPPEPFWLRITRLHTHEDQIRGATGVVEQAGRLLNGLWATFCVRDGGGANFYNLTTQPAKHNIRIGSSEPVVAIAGESVPMVEWIQFQGVETLSGIAYIAESAECLGKVLERDRYPDG